MVTNATATPRLLTDEEVADQIVEAVKDMWKFGWCTGRLFQVGGAACAIGNLLKTVGVTHEPETEYNSDGVCTNSKDITATTYKHPGIRQAMIELAKDMRQDSAFRAAYEYSGAENWAAHEVVWHYNDSVAGTVEAASEQFLKTARRLYRG